MIAQLVDLLDMLETWPGIDEHRSTIDERREQLERHSPGQVIGEGPVATLNFKLAPEFIREWGLYVSSVRRLPQIFLWGDERTDVPFSQFCKALEKQ